MGITHATLKVKENFKKKDFIEIKFLVDSGAVYSLVPGKELKKIGLKPHRKTNFVLADGTEIERNVGDAYFEWHGEGGAAPVIFGEEGVQPLLGSTTLASLGIVLNIFTRKLTIMRTMLA